MIRRQTDCRWAESRIGFNVNGRGFRVKVFAVKGYLQVEHARKYFAFGNKDWLPVEIYDHVFGSYREPQIRKTKIQKTQRRQKVWHLDLDVIHVSEGTLAVAFVSE